jgi:flavin-dependent dehydrogenase
VNNNQKHFGQDSRWNNETMSDVTILPCWGGPAGAACAIELARNGRPVTVLEKTRLAHHKVCGEFLSVEAQALLAYLGLNIQALGATEIGTYSLASGSNFRAVHLPFRGAGLSRFSLDQALLQLATEAGAEVQRGVTVTRLISETAAIAVHTTEQEYHAARVVVATGKHDVKDCTRPKTSTLAFKLQLRAGTAAVGRLRNFVHLTVFPGGYAGACLVESEALTLCWLIEQRLLKQIGIAWDTQAGYLASQSSFLRDLISQAEPLWQKAVAIGAVQQGFLRKRPLSELVYPIGDQLAVIPPFTGDGMAIALNSGIAAARAILNDMPASEFQGKMIAGLRRQMLWAKAGNLLFSTAPAQRMTGAIAKAVPWTLPKLVTFMAHATRLRGVKAAERAADTTQAAR